MNEETQNMIATVRTVMHLLGVPQAQVGKAMGLHGSSLNKLLSGRMGLRFEHILDVSAALGLKPQELLRFAYPHWGEPPSDAGRQVREVAGHLLCPSPPAAPAPPPEAWPAEGDVERMVVKAMRRVFSEKIGEPCPTEAATTAEA